MIALLTPPYRTLSQRTSNPPLGSILLADLNGGIVELCSGIVAHQTYPWCPLCLLNGDILEEDQAVAFAALQSSLARVNTIPGSGFDPERILLAVRKRPPPSPESLARYVAIRTRKRECFVPLVDAMSGTLSEHVAPERPARTLSRKIGHLGQLSVRNWAGIAKAIRIITTHRATRHDSLERLALENAVHPRSLRGWLRLCTELTFSSIKIMPGWEWLLESALRKWGYVKDMRIEVNARIS